MELVGIKCNKCGTEFMVMAKEGEIVCPECGNVDYLQVED